MKELAAIAGILLMAISVSWIAEGDNFFLYRYFGPKQEAVRRQVFEQSHSYNTGMTQELENMQMQYLQADKEHKDALADLILHRAAGYNLNDPSVSNDLRGFIESLNAGRRN